jgi:hypothetical protein
MRAIVQDSYGPADSAQRHHGENIGDTPTRVVFVELKEASATAVDSTAVTEEGVGPQSS